MSAAHGSSLLRVGGGGFGALFGGAAAHVELPIADDLPLHIGTKFLTPELAARHALDHGTPLGWYAVERPLLDGLIAAPRNSKDLGGFHRAVKVLDDGLDDFFGAGFGFHGHQYTLVSLALLASLALCGAKPQEKLPA